MNLIKPDMRNKVATKLQQGLDMQICTKDALLLHKMQAKKYIGSNIMEEKRISPLKSIRLKCLDCCCRSSNEVKLCPVTNCPLYPFREGHNPFIAKRENTEEQKEAIKTRLMNSRILTAMEKPTNSISEG